MKGVLYGVGVGPGDPELLTLKAVRIIGQCSVIAAPDSGGKEQLALAIAGEYIRDKTIVRCPLPMTRDTAVLEKCQREAAEKLCGYLEKGQDVAFLTLGDPAIYATYGYLHKLVMAAGYRAVMVPGVPSFCAAAAALGEPLCEGEQPLHILPASCESLSASLDAQGTKVIMKMGRKQRDILALLREKDLLGCASMAERCTLEGETVTRDLTGLPRDSGYFAVVVVKGEG